jgi:hypothetical protein
VASDERMTLQTRLRADAALQEMTAKNLFTAAVTADYAAETVDFIRTFDCNDHDPARTPQDVRQFLFRMEILFSKGFLLGCFRDVDGPSPSTRERTFVQIVLDQCRDATQIQYGARVFCLWSKVADNDATQVTAAMLKVVQVMQERVTADFSAVDLASSFEIFNLWVWRQLDKHEPLIPRVHASENKLCFHCKRLAKALGIAVDKVDSAWLQLSSAARCLAADVESSHSFDSVDNRDMWALVLDPQWWTGLRDDDNTTIDVVLSLGTGLAVPREIARMVTFYLTVTDGTGRPGAQDWLEMHLEANLPVSWEL